MTSTRARPSAADIGFGPRFKTPILISTSLNPINTTLITVALAPIANALHVRSSTVIWLVAALYLTSAISQPTMGKLADHFGPRRVQQTGLALAMAAGLVPLLTPTFAGALIARILIGIGTSAAYPSAMTLIRRQSAHLGIKTPQTILSAVSVSSLATAAIGPFLGGVLIALFGWQAIFVVNVPLAGLGLVLSRRWLPGDRARTSQHPGSLGDALDPVGIVMFAVTVAAALFFLLNLSSHLWWLLVIFLIALGALLFWERHRTRPFIDVRLLARNGALSRTYLRLFLTYTSVYLIAFAFSQWLQDSVGLSASDAGLAQVPYALLAGAAALTVAKTAKVRMSLVLAAIVPLVAGLLFTLITSSTPLVWIIAASALFGVPQGLASVSNQAIMYRQVPAENIGTAAGLSRTSIYLGAITSSSLIGLVYGSRPSDQGIHTIAWIIVGACTLVLALTLTDRSLSDDSASK